MSTYRVEGNALHLVGGQQVRFPYDVQSAMVFGDIIVVVLDVPRGVQFNRNVYGVTMSGDIRWQIVDVFRVSGHGPLGGLAARGDHAFLGSWSGVAVILDPATGRVIQEIMQQR